MYFHCKINVICGLLLYMCKIISTFGIKQMNLKRVTNFIEIKRFLLREIFLRNNLLLVWIRVLTTINVHVILKQSAE